MINFWRILVLLVSISAQAAEFQEAEPTSAPLSVEVTPVVLLNAAAPTQKKNGGSLGWTGEVASGYGLLASISILNSAFDLETGAVYMKQASERDNAGTSLRQETHGIHVPLLIRFNFDEQVGIGVGGYAGFAKGEVQTIQNGNTVNGSYSSVGIHNRDFGLLFSARASLKIVPQLYFVVDGRYQHGLTNLANIPPGLAGDTLNTRSMQAYLGLSYRFQAF